MVSLEHLSPIAGSVGAGNITSNHVFLLEAFTVAYTQNV
jgi:hypothetical protein